MIIIVIVITIRYVDLTEAIDTGDGSFLDNSDLQDADAVPLNGPLSETHYLDDEVCFCFFICFFFSFFFLFFFICFINYNSFLIIGYERRCSYMGFISCY